MISLPPCFRIISIHRDNSFSAFPVILHLTKQTLLIAQIIRVNRHCVASSEIRWNRANERRSCSCIVGILPRGNYQRSANGPSPYRTRSLRRSWPRLSADAWYSCAVLPCRWIELIPRGEKSRALRLSYEALTFTNYSRYEVRLYVIDTERPFTRHVRRLIIPLSEDELSTFRISKVRIFLCYLSHSLSCALNYHSSIIPWAISLVCSSPVHKISVPLVFSWRSSCVHSFLLHAQYHLAVLMTSLFPFPFLFY